jgi:hypothetical protein
MSPLGTLNYPLAVATLLVVVPLSVPVSPLLPPSAFARAEAAAAAAGNGKNGFATQAKKPGTCAWLGYGLRWSFQLVVLAALSPMGLAAGLAALSGQRFDAFVRLFVEQLPVSDNLAFPVFAFVYLPLYLVSLTIACSRKRVSPGYCSLREALVPGSPALPPAALSPASAAAGGPSSGAEKNREVKEADSPQQLSKKDR